MGRHKLVVIGAGPHSLALLARLKTEYPSSMYTDEQQERIIFHKGKTSRTPKELEGVCVVDPYGEWMHQWKMQFKAYGIKFLRSPSFFHVEPSHLEALRGFAASNGLLDELSEFTEGLFNSKIKEKNLDSLFNERDRLDYLVPSSKLFIKFCEHVIDSYNLQNMVRQGKVVDMVHKNKAFTVYIERCDKTIEVITSDNVVVSIGMMNIPRVPIAFSSMVDVGLATRKILHSKDLISAMDNIKSAYPIDALNSINAGKSPKLLIVGGGLTSGHLCCLAAKNGISNITLVSRSFLRIKHFDVDLDWVGRYRNVLFSKFYQSSFEERYETIKSARGGGSMTPSVRHELKLLEDRSILRIREQCEVQCCQMDESGRINVIFNQNSSQQQFDIVWLGTGCKIDVSSEPLFRKIMEKYPIDVVEGYPCLTSDLAWSNELDSLYFTGGYAALQLGPNALNLHGSRAAADRIATSLQDKWGRNIDGCETTFGDCGNYYKLLLGHK